MRGTRVKRNEVCVSVGEGVLGAGARVIRFQRAGVYSEG